MRSTQLLDSLLDEAREATLRVAMVRYACAYTDRAPALEVEVVPDSESRVLGAVLYLLAALIEAASPGQPWDVAVEERGRGCGRVVLRLATESGEGARRALKTLQHVALVLRQA